MCVNDAAMLKLKQIMLQKGMVINAVNWSFEGFLNVGVWLKKLVFTFG